MFVWKKFDERSQNKLNSTRNPESFSTLLTTNSQIIRSVMAAIISHFEGSFSPNRIEVEGEAIPLAIIKTTTDWATEMVSQNLYLPSSVYRVPVQSMQEYSKAHHLVKNLFP